MNGLLAVALVCAASIPGPDCSRDNALDMVVQPVALMTECQKVGQVLASHLSLQPGEYHKVACERRTAPSSTRPDGDRSDLDVPPGRS